MFINLKSLGSLYMFCCVRVDLLVFLGSVVFVRFAGVFCLCVWLVGVFLVIPVTSLNYLDITIQPRPQNSGNPPLLLMFFLQFEDKSNAKEYDYKIKTEYVVH